MSAERRKPRIVALFLSLSFTLATPATCGEAGGVTQEEVDAALEKGKAAALRNLERYQFSNLGYSVVCVMALLNAGVPRDDPAIDAAMQRIVREADRSVREYEAAYQAGLISMLLGMLKDPAQRRLSERMALSLQRLQSNDGGWGSPHSDYSRTQFALLGLKAALDQGISVPADVFKRARRYVEIGQNKADGSWGYTPDYPFGYGSMTAAGITSLFIVNEQINKESALCGAAPSDDRTRRALGWLGEHFSVRANPNYNHYHYYYLYALERIGVLTGQKRIGGHDWYREGAEYLVRQQRPDGSWADPNGRLATEFALLFLGKGRDPVAMQKLAHNGEWNPDPYDAKDLVELASRDLQTRMISQVVDAGAPLSAFAAAPILYLQGRGPFSFDKAARETIRAYVEQGNFLFASACCGDREFDRAFRAEMAQIFPGCAFEKLPASHDIYSLKHRIAAPEAFMIEGLNTGCRTAVLFAPHDICCAWGGCKGCADKSCLAGAEGKKLGVNMIQYALTFKKLRSKLSEDPAFAIGKSGAAQRNTLVIGQLFHSSDWNPDPASLANLGKTLKDSTGNSAEFAARQVVLGTDDPGDFPMLYLTGHQTFQYLPSQIDALRAYLDRGGFLLAEPCCGKLEFDASFRRLCSQLYADRPLEMIAATHRVLQSPYKIEKVEYKPAVKRLFPTLGGTPQVEGISAPDGRLQILYSRFNFGCELQGHGCPNCLGLAKDDAWRLAVNAVLYAVSH